MNLPPRILGLAVGLLAAAAMAHAGQITVTLDTRQLIGSPAGPFYAGFQLADGSLTGDGNNAVAVSNVQFGGGMPIPPGCSKGSTSGDLSSSMTLTDLGVFAYCTEAIVPGNTLSFDVSYTANTETAPGPADEFVMVILDSNLTPIPTTGGIALLQIDFDSPNPSVQTFAGDPTQSEPANGGFGIAIPAPVVSTIQPCVFSLDRASASVGSGSGLFLDTTPPSNGVFLTSLTGAFTLAAANCGAGDQWTVTSNKVPILAVARGAFAAGVLPSFSVNGDGSAASTPIGFAMFSNTTSSARTATITVSGTQNGQGFILTFTVQQAASGDSTLPRVVRALYQTILGREPDPGGFSFWTSTGAPQDAQGNILDNEMADDFYRSPEFASNGWEVISIYQAVELHPPSYSQWISGVTPLRPGTPAPALVENLLDSLTGSITDTAFVQMVTLNSWGRPLTPSELAQYVGQISASSSPTARLDFLNNTVFANSAFTNNTNPNWVSALYFTILVRDPDPSGLMFWVVSATNPPGQPGIYYLPAGPGAAYQQKLFLIGQAVPPNPAFLGFLGSPEFQGLIH